MLKNKGQITIAAVIMGLGAMALTAFGFYTASNVRTDNKIGVVQKDTTTVSEWTARVEEAILTLKEDNKTIKNDLKEILKILK